MEEDVCAIGDAAAAESATGEEEEEFCCTCDETFENKTQFQSHVESDRHLQKLLDDRFISRKHFDIINIFNQLLLSSNTTLSFRDFKLFLNTLRSKAVPPSSTDCMKVSSLGAGASREVNGTKSEASAKCNHSNISEGGGIVEDGRVEFTEVSAIDSDKDGFDSTQDNPTQIVDPKSIVSNSSGTFAINNVQSTQLNFEGKESSTCETGSTNLVSSSSVSKESAQTNISVESTEGRPFLRKRKIFTTEGHFSISPKGLFASHIKKLSPISKHKSVPLRGCHRSALSNSCSSSNEDQMKRLSEPNVEAAANQDKRVDEKTKTGNVGNNQVVFLDIHSNVLSNSTESSVAAAANSVVCPVSTYNAHGIDRLANTSTSSKHLRLRNGSNHIEERWSPWAWTNHGPEESLSVLNCCLNQPTGDSCVPTATGPDHNDRLEELCKFVIYQCMTCKALVTHQNDGIRKHQSTYCPSTNQTLALKCLVCEISIVSQTMFIKHRELVSHRIALKHVFFNYRKMMSECSSNLTKLKNENHKFQPLLMSLSDHSKVMGEKIYNIIKLVKLISMFAKDCNYLGDISPNMNVQLIPELEFYLKRGLMYLFPQRLSKFRGLFICTVCLYMFSNLYTFLHHSLTSFKHMMLACFHADNFTFTCLSCNVPHIQTYLSLFESAAKVDSSGQRIKCLSAKEHNDKKKALTIECLDKLSFIDLNLVRQRYFCESCHIVTIGNLADLHQHLAASPRYESPVHSLADCSVGCGCCKKTFTSFTDLVIHALLDNNSVVSVV